MILPELTVIIFAAFLAACVAVWAARRTSTEKLAFTPTEEEPMALLFDHDELHHATTRALHHLAFHPGLHDWQDLREALLARFPDFPLKSGAGQTGHMTLVSTDGEMPSKIALSWRDSLCWVRLLCHDDRPQTVETHPDTATLAALRRESDASPHPAWQQDSQGNMLWHNQAYDILSRMKDDSKARIGSCLFETHESDNGNRVPFLTSDSDKPDWYALSTVQIEDVTVNHATCINALVAAEEAQRNFIQTLAKTFAHLSIGLAIFDRNGQLALFNPALVDLTRLPAHFLSARPTILSFFDQLRENRRMPEPKNYRTWRQEIAELISAAADGRYQETWSLETGQTYSVNGRPHPDGATAFLIEDISAEVAQTRNFRAELELGQSLLDTIDEALAVFSPSGVLTFCNQAYQDLWQHTPESSFADVMITDALTIWKQQTAPNPLWAEVRDFMSDLAGRQIWSFPICLKDGTAFSCQLHPIASGSTLIRFTRTDTTTADRKSLATSAVD